MNLQHPLAWWLANNPILTVGQQGIVTDLSQYKIGDGVNNFSLLPFNNLGEVNSWFSFSGPTGNTGSILSTLWQTELFGGTFGQQGAWAEFSFDLTPASNINAKTAYLKLSNQHLINVIIPISSSAPVTISGKIKCYDYTGKKVYFKCKSESNGTAINVSEGILTGIDFTQNNKIICQVSGVSNNDVISQGGDGKICPMASI
jgi:hypothetical protein